MKKLLPFLLVLVAGFAQAQNRMVDLGNVPAISIDKQQSAPNGALLTKTNGLLYTYSSGASNFTVTNNPTDIATLFPNNEGRRIRPDYVEIITSCASCTATTVIDVLVQRSVNGGGGTSVNQPIAKHDQNDAGSTGAFAIYSSNRNSLGNGVSDSRPIIRSGKLTIAPGGAPSSVRFTFGDGQTSGAILGSLIDWLAINLNGQVIPSGTVFSISIQWTEEEVPKVFLIGDSTTDLANFMFQYLWNDPKIKNHYDVRNYGSNGMRAENVLLKTSSPKYALSTILSYMPERYSSVVDKVIVSFLINNTRDGSTTKNQGISLLDAIINVVKNGCIAGQSYTSPIGAGTTFPCPATIAGDPAREIILVGPNALAADDPLSAGYVTTTGLYTGMTLAQAAQTASTIMYDAYQYFKDTHDPRVKAVLQVQDLPGFGKISLPLAQEPYLTDPLHPNARGQKAKGAQLVPEIVK